MDRFIWRYLFFLVVILSFLYLPSNPIAQVLHQAQVDLTLWGLNAVLPEGILNGIDIRINSNYKIYISQSCNGLAPVAFFFASVIAYPSSWLRRIVWMALGYIVFSIANVVRIWFVVYATRTGAGQKEFFWSHDIVGNAWLVLVGLGLFMAFVRQAR